MPLRRPVDSIYSVFLVVLRPARTCPLITLIHPSAWKWNSTKFAGTEFSDVRLVLLRRVCGFLFFYYLQAFDLLEGEAHDAAVFPLVLEVDGLVVVVDHDLRRHPAAVVEPLCPLGDVFVLYPLGLLAHPFAPSLTTVSLPRRGSIYSTEMVRDCYQC